jgi:hypothetical protein
MPASSSSLQLRGGLRFAVVVPSSAKPAQRRDRVVVEQLQRAIVSII